MFDNYPESSLLYGNLNYGEKITNLEQIPVTVRNWKAEGNIVGLVGGGFDIIHYRHLEFLLACSSFLQSVGKFVKLVVLVSSEKRISTTKYKGGRIISIPDTLKHLSFLPFADLISENEETFRDVGMIQPDYFFLSTQMGEKIYKQLEVAQGIISELKQETKIVVLNSYYEVIKPEEIPANIESNVEGEISSSKIRASVINRWQKYGN